MSGDLEARLARGAGPAGPAPDLDGFWARGRCRRRRRQVGTGLGAILAVAAVVAGGMALTGDRGDEGVYAGPGSVAPPPEPIDVPVRMVAEAGPPLDGIPTLEPGDPVVISYLGDEDGWARGVSLDWEAWHGSSWEQTHTLIVGRAPDGSDGEVVPVGEDLLIPAAGMLGPGPNSFPTPSDARPGWYRVCVEVGTSGGGGDASAEPPGVSSTVLPASSEVDASPGSVLGPAADGDRQRLRPCAQLRVLSPAERVDARADDDPATEEVSVTAHVSMSPAAAGAVHPGAFFMVTTEATAGGWHVATMASWERWGGERWRRTHILEGVGANAGAGDEPSVRSDPDASVRWAATSESPALPHGIRFIAPQPGDAPPGRYRVCLRAVRSWEQPGEERTEVCVPVVVESEPSSEGGDVVPPSTGATTPG